MPYQKSDLSFTPLTEGRTEVSRTLSGNRSGAPVSLIIDSSCRVHIDHIPFSRIERDGANALRAEFEAFGPVESYKMFTERSGRFIGSVLCTYCNPADASMAVNNMNGLSIDDATLKVTLSRDHGVVLLHQGGTKNQQNSAAGNKDGSSEGKWEHDRYQAILNGTAEIEEDYVFGQRRGGRGRRGGGGGGRGRGMNSVDKAFEEYIAERDNVVDAAEAVPEKQKIESEENADADIPAKVDAVTPPLEAAVPETNPPE